jgi:hypothetical protein
MLALVKALVVRGVSSLVYYYFPFPSTINELKNTHPLGSAPIAVLDMVLELDKLRIPSSPARSQTPRLSRWSIKGEVCLEIVCQCAPKRKQKSGNVERTLGIVKRNQACEKKKDPNGKKRQERGALG